MSGPRKILKERRDNFMDILYRVQEERRENEETGRYIAYGIEALSGGALCRAADPQAGQRAGLGNGVYPHPHV